MRHLPVRTALFALATLAMLACGSSGTGASDNSSSSPSGNSGSNGDSNSGSSGNGGQTASDAGSLGGGSGSGGKSDAGSSGGGTVTTDAGGGTGPADAGGTISNDAASGTGGSGGGSSCASVPAWASGVSYAVGEQVTYNAAFYTCIQAHTSEPGWTPSSTPSLWSPSTCTGGSGTGGSTGGNTGTSDAGSSDDSGASTPDSGGASTGGPTGKAPAGLIFSPYKDTSINMNWNTNVITTDVPGTATNLATDLAANGGNTITLAFATGECGSENWGGVAGAAMASANVSLLKAANVNYILSTGGAAGSFTCGTDTGMETFISNWSSPNLIGVDFDIEAGQSQSVINDLVARIQTAHGVHPGLRFSLTLATLAVNSGASTATSLGSAAQDSFNTYGDNVMTAVESTLGFTVGNSSTWPSYLTVDLMVMDYGSPSDGVCVVSGGACDMGQSALQAAYNLHDKWGVPYSNIELTPMIGGNDAAGETFTLANADTVAAFAISQGLAGVHFWSYDRDIDCAPGSASATCNTYGVAGTHGFLKRFLNDGL